MTNDKPSRYPPEDPEAREFKVFPDMVGRFTRRGRAMVADNATVVGDVHLGGRVAEQLPVRRQFLHSSAHRHAQWVVQFVGFFIQLDQLPPSRPKGPRVCQSPGVCEPLFGHAVTIAPPHDAHRRLPKLLPTLAGLAWPFLPTPRAPSDHG